MVSVSHLVSARQVAYTQSQTDTLSVSTGYVADPPMHTPYATAVVNAFYAVLDNAYHLLIYRPLVVRDTSDLLLSRPKLVSRFLAVVGGLKGHAAEQLTASACVARVCSIEPESSCNSKPNYYSLTALQEGVFNHIFLGIRDALGVSILLWHVRPQYLARMLHGLVALTTLYVMDCQGISQHCKALSLNLKLCHGIFVRSISSPYAFIEHMNDGKAKFFLHCIASRNHPMCFSKCHLLCHATSHNQYFI